MFRLKELLKADERNTEALYDMAVLQERLGKPDEAQRWLERAAEVAAKNDPAPNYALVDLHLRQGHASQAQDAAKALLAKLPEDVKALSTYARAQMASGDPAGAKQSLLNASRRAGFDAAQQAEVAALQLDLGDLDNAAYSLDKALSNSPDHLAANVLMTGVEIRRNELAKAGRAQNASSPATQSFLSATSCSETLPALAAKTVLPPTPTGKRIASAQAAPPRCP